MPTITATVIRGKKKGERLTPHRYQGGFYLVSKGGNTLDFSQKIYHLHELIKYIQLGYSVRMSTPGVAPSLYSPKSISYISQVTP